MPKRAKTNKILCPAPLLTILLIRDDERFMAKCPELDLVTEMDTPQQALHAMLEMIREYAEDYRAREKIFTASPNRAHHKPYIDRVLACRDEWELWELIEIRHGRLHQVQLSHGGRDVPPGTFAEILHFSKQIPDRAVICFQVKGEEAFNRWSRRVARERAERERKPVVYVAIHRLRPVRSRIEKAELAHVT